MSKSIVIGLDSSTQSTKAIAWDRQGNALAEGRDDIPMQNPRLDCFEQDPNDWWQSSINALKDCLRQVDTASIQGLAISNQRETIAFLDSVGDQSYPAMVWLDERTREQVKSFPAAFGVDRIHKITGRMPDMTPALYRIVWLRENEPAAWDNTRYVVDVQSYLVKQLCGGEYRNGWISADPLGMYDLVEKCWSAPLLEAMGLSVDKLPKPHAPGTHLGTITDAVASLTGLPVGLPVYAAGGDGQCAGLGVNCTVPGRAYINLGTAMVSGTWSPNYQYNTAWRTELAAQGEGYIYENCLRSGAFLINWFVDQFVAQGRADADTFDQLEQAALKLPVGSDGLLVQPYFSGVMDPHWDESARGVMIGLCASHTNAHIYRALIESLTIDQVMRSKDLEDAAGQATKQMIVIGGGANSKLWTQMLADALGKPVYISTTVEASALGAGMIAAYGAGWYDSITEAANGMAGSTTAIEPDMARHEAYQELLSIYRKLYSATREINHELVAFASKHAQPARSE